MGKSDGLPHSALRASAKWQVDCLRRGHDARQRSRPRRPDVHVRVRYREVLFEVVGAASLVRRIAWQLADAGTSIAANYEEAKAAYSRREFKAKTSIVLKEARESRLWLRVIAANGLARREELNPLVKGSNELVAIFTASMKTLRLGEAAKQPDPQSQ